MEYPKTIRTQKINCQYTCLTSEKTKININWKSNPYEIKLLKDKDGRFTAFQIISLNRTEQINLKLLMWLSLYIGEDCLNPTQSEDTRFVWFRGLFKIDQDCLQNYLLLCERLPFKSYPKWKQEAFDLSLTYYLGGTRLGFLNFPVPLGLFSVSIEILSSIYKGSRNMYANLGTRKFNQIINERAKKMMMWSPASKQKINKIKKYIQKDFELLIELRNSLSAHSLIHQREKRKQLIQMLKEWYVRNGHSKQFTANSFKVTHWRTILTSESWNLFKLGLRLNRLMYFHFIGYHNNIPFASHDWSILGDSNLMGSNVKLTIK